MDISFVVAQMYADGARSRVAGSALPDAPVVADRGRRRRQHRLPAWLTVLRPVVTIRSGRSEREPVPAPSP